MQRVAILGATGTIGRCALDVIARHPHRFKASILTAHRRLDDLLALCRTHVPDHAVIADAAAYPGLRDGLKAARLPTQAHAGQQAIADLVASTHTCDTVIAAIVGIAGLPSTMAAVGAGHRLLLANKESLVVAGSHLIDCAQRQQATIIPIDSEHNAIFQCLRSCQADAVRRILLTASGGPFRGWNRAALADVTPEQAIAHPKWTMGQKISVDSATMMNKGLEVIEAHHLFGLESDRIDVLVHPQALIHGFVELANGSMLAQLGLPDMRTALAVGLGWPTAIASGVEGLNLLHHNQMEFAPPDVTAFPCLRLARHALECGGNAPTILNAANEIAVSFFLQRRIGFLDIAACVEDALATIAHASADSLEDRIATDALTRRLTHAKLAQARRSFHFSPLTTPHAHG